MTLQLNTVNITLQEDWKEVERAWKGWFEDEDEVKNEREMNFKPYKEMLEKLQVIVGFGRGFWRGDDSYYYLVYHTETKRYYWYLRDVESDDSVYFYKINKDAKILQLLQTLAIPSHFDEFDEALQPDVLWDLAHGNTEDMPHDFKSVSLAELFGEDTEELRVALMYFSPGDYGSKYPHHEFHNRFFLPSYQKRLDKEVEVYNQSESVKIFREGNKLMMYVDNDLFELKKVKK